MRARRPVASIQVLRQIRLRTHSVDSSDMQLLFYSVSPINIKCGDYREAGRCNPIYERSHDKQ